MKEGKQYILGSVRGEGKEPEVTRGERPGTLPELLKAGSSLTRREPKIRYCVNV